MPWISTSDSYVLAAGSRKDTAALGLDQARLAMGVSTRVAATQVATPSSQVVSTAGIAIAGLKYTDGSVQTLLDRFGPLRHRRSPEWLPGNDPSLAVTSTSRSWLAPHSLEEFWRIQMRATAFNGGQLR
jgi:hypothetical protein